jgi:hypothetical protein
MFLSGINGSDEDNAHPSVSRFILHGQTLNQTYYVEILKRLREAVGRKRPELWPSDWILHHDKAHIHKALSVKQFLAQKSITEIEYPHSSFLGSTAQFRPWSPPQNPAEFLRGFSTIFIFTG